MSIPHPEKLHKHGEDASFIHRRALGVFDGVGSWAQDGIDAGKYSKQLASLTEVLYHSKDNTSIVQSLSGAVSRNSYKGSCTACVAEMKEDSLCGINVGDSGLLVVRNGRIVYATKEQCHGFNYPFQVSFENQEDLQSGEQFRIAMKKGDVVVLASDGLWDNVYKNEIVKVVKKHASQWRAVKQMGTHGPENKPASAAFQNAVISRDVLERWPASGEHVSGGRLQELVFDLAGHACSVAHSKSRSSPFAVKSKEAHHQSHHGGKLDDITIVVATVVSSSERYCAAFESVCAPCKR